jgi:hypothetical protein
MVTGTDAADFRGLAVDASGNAFVCGQLYQQQTFGDITVNPGNFRPFVAKINGNGDWQWVHAQGGFGGFGGWAFAVATDASGNPYITGTMGGGQDSGNTFFGLPFPKSGECPFVAKFNGANGAAIWATNAPTQGFYALSNIGREIAVLSDGSAYVGGHFYGQGVFGGTTLTPLQHADGDVTFFLARISSTGQWLWATMGEATPRARSAVLGLALDAQDNAWVQGYTSANFFYGAGTDGRVTLAGVGITNSAFIAKVNTSGTFLLARKTRSAGSVSPRVDDAGYLYWTGNTGLGVDGLIKFGPASAPAITVQPTNQVVRLGDAFLLTATATGLPVYYQWRKDGTALADFTESLSTNGTFQISYTPNRFSPNFAPGDIGNYTLVVSNSAGMATSAVAAVTAPVPAITGLFNMNNVPITNAQPLEVVFIRGTNFTGATALTLGTLQIGVPLQATFNPQLFYGSWSLNSDTQIRVVMPVHYLADPFTVTTPGGAAASPGTMQINLPVYQSAATNTAGQNEYFSTWDSPNFAFQWFKDNVPLTNSTHVSGATTGGIADFSVTTSGETPVSFQWLKDGVQLTTRTTRASAARRRTRYASQAFRSATAGSTPWSSPSRPARSPARTSGSRSRRRCSSPPRRRTNCSRPAARPHSTSWPRAARR